jgi:hypothetical protein
MLQAADSSDEDKALAFTENVLPFDSTQYDIKISYLLNTTLMCTLTSPDNTMVLFYTIHNDAITSVRAVVGKGEPIYKESCNNLIDATKQFLQKYQTHTSIDTSKMLDILSNVKSIENSVITKNDLKLTISHIDSPDSILNGMIHFNWVKVINGCTYGLLSITFKDDTFQSFTEYRGTYTIGDDSIKISEKQAIKIALKAIEGFSYTTPDKLTVTDYKILEKKIHTTLGGAPKNEQTVLYPFWGIYLPVEDGGVILVGVWANTGEVHSPLYLPYDPIGDDLTTDTSKPFFYDTDILAIIIAILIAVVLVITAIALTTKKRHKPNPDSTIPPPNFTP